MSPHGLQRGLFGFLVATAMCIGPWMLLRHLCFARRYTWWQEESPHVQQAALEREYEVLQHKAILARRLISTWVGHAEYDEKVAAENHHHDEAPLDVSDSNSNSSSNSVSICVAVLTKRRPVRQYIGVTLPLLIHRWPFGRARHRDRDHKGSSHVDDDYDKRNHNHKLVGRDRLVVLHDHGSELGDDEHPILDGMRNMLGNGIATVLDSPQQHQHYHQHSRKQMQKQKHGGGVVREWEANLSRAHARAIRACLNEMNGMSQKEEGTESAGDDPERRDDDTDDDDDDAGLPSTNRFVIVLEDDALVTRDVGAKIHALIDGAPWLHAEPEKWLLVRLFDTDYYAGWEYTARDVATMLCCSVLAALVLLRYVLMCMPWRGEGRKVGVFELVFFIATGVHVFLMMHAVGKQNICAPLHKLYIRAVGPHITPYSTGPSAVATLFSPKHVLPYAQYLEEHADGGVPADQLQNTYAEENGLLQHHARPDLFQHIGAHSSVLDVSKGRGYYLSMKTSPSWDED